MIKDRLFAGMFLGVVFSMSLLFAFEAGRNGRWPTAEAENAPPNAQEHSYTAFSGYGSTSGSLEDIILVDSKANKLAVYQVKGGQLEFVAVRSLQFDFKCDRFGSPQKPEAEEIKKLLPK